MEQYKTAAELGITEREREALIKTIEILEAGPEFTFNMAWGCGVETTSNRDQPVLPLVQATPTCGTHLCIGGTMGLLLANNMVLPDVVTAEMSSAIEGFMDTRGLKEYDHSEAPFEHLFYDIVDSSPTVADGIAATREFLRGNTVNPWCGLTG